MLPLERGAIAWFGVCFGAWDTSLRSAGLRWASSPNARSQFARKRSFASPCSVIAQYSLAARSLVSPMRKLPLTIIQVWPAHANLGTLRPKPGTPPPETNARYSKPGLPTDKSRRYAFPGNSAFKERPRTRVSCRDRGDRLLARLPTLSYKNAMDQFSSIAKELGALWDLFANASPLANAITILPPVLTLVAGVRWLLHRRLKSKDGRIHDLEGDVKRRDEQLAEVRATLSETRKQCEAAERRLPEAALAMEEKEFVDGNDERANRALAAWCQSEGIAISEVLFKRAKWAVSHAAGEGHAPGLVAAEGWLSPQCLSCRNILKRRGC